MMWLGKTFGADSSHVHLATAPSRFMKPYDVSMHVGKFVYKLLHAIKSRLISHLTVKTSV